MGSLRAPDLAGYILIRLYPNDVTFDPALDDIFVIPLASVSPEAEEIWVRGLELTPEHPGFEHRLVHSLFEAAQEFTDVTDCLHVERGAEVVDLRALARHRLDTRREFELCLYRIFAYLDGPSEVAAWLSAIGFIHVGEPFDMTWPMWNAKGSMDVSIMNAYWVPRSECLIHNYPLSARYRFGQAALSSQLGVQTIFDGVGRVQDINISVIYAFII